MHGSLMRSFNGNRNMQAVQTITMPEEIVEVRIKPNSKTTIEIYFDQWIISMRLHNADTNITRTSLKFDVQIKQYLLFFYPQSVHIFPLADFPYLKEETNCL